MVREWIEAEDAPADGVRFTLLTERHRQAIRRFVETDALDDAERTTIIDGVPGRAQRRGASAPGVRAPPVVVLDTFRRRHV